MKIRLRKKTQTFLTKTSLRAYHCIEVLHNRKWSMLGDDNGVYKFETAEARDEIMRNLEAANGAEAPALRNPTAEMRNSHPNTTNLPK